MVLRRILLMCLAWQVNVPGVFLLSLFTVISFLLLKGGFCVDNLTHSMYKVLSMELVVRKELVVHFMWLKWLQTPPHYPPTCFAVF